MTGQNLILSVTCSDSNSSRPRPPALSFLLALGVVTRIDKIPVCGEPEETGQEADRCPLHTMIGAKKETSKVLDEDTEAWGKEASRWEGLSGGGPCNGGGGVENLRVEEQLVLSRP